MIGRCIWWFSGLSFCIGSVTGVRVTRKLRPETSVTEVVTDRESGLTHIPADHTVCLKCTSWQNSPFIIPLFFFFLLSPYHFSAAWSSCVQQPHLHSGTLYCVWKHKGGLFFSLCLQKCDMKLSVRKKNIKKQSSVSHVGQCDVLPSDQSEWRIRWWIGVIWNNVKGHLLLDSNVDSAQCSREITPLSIQTLNCISRLTNVSGRICPLAGKVRVDCAVTLAVS